MRQSSLVGRSGREIGVCKIKSSRKAFARKPRLDGATKPILEHLEGRMLLSVVLAPRVDYSVGSAPRAVVSADFNGDGHLDLAAVNAMGNTVSVLMNKGDGTFLAKADYAVGTFPISVAAGDFNGDGNIDLAVANRDDNTVSVLLNNADGTFAPASTYATGIKPWSVVAADFGGVGGSDLAVANFNDGTVSILLNNGNGGFLAQATYSAGTHPVSLTAGDFNSDGNPDLAVACGDGSGTVQVLLNSGDGTFTAGNSYAMGQYCSSITSADFDADGKLDLAVGEQGANAVGVLRGKGDGSFAAKTDYPAGKSPMSVVASDFSGDGKADLAVGNGLDNNVSLFLNKGDGTFTFNGNYQTATSPYSLAAADYNGDGLSDVAAADFGAASLSMLRTLPDTTPVNVPDANLKQAIRAALGKPAGDITIADMQSLTSLSARNKGIVNLTGLEYAANLTQLDLGQNQISDLSPVSSDFNLSDLKLDSNQIANPYPLSALTSLVGLSLDNNRIIDIASLSSLTNLQSLGLSGNSLVSLQPLSGLTSLTSLQLDATGISDISPLAGLTSLSSLYLATDHISDISPLAGLTNLTSLSLSANTITEVSALAGMTKLVNLSLSWGSITDITPLAGMTGLARLDLAGNQVADISTLVGLSALQNVNVKRNSLDLSNGSAAMGIITTLIGRGVTVAYMNPPGTVLATTTSADKITVSWLAAPAASGYELWRNTSNNSATATRIQASLTALSYDDTSIPRSVQYWYWVKATDGVDMSDFSDPAQGLRAALDLVGLSLTLPASPTTVLAGGLLAATRAYQVIGPTPSFYIQYRLSTDKIWGNADDMLLAQADCINLAGDKSVGTHSKLTTLTMPWNLKTGATYYLLGKIDSTGLVTEDNENNNVIVSAAQVKVVAPVNDAFTRRLALVGASVTTVGNNANATKEVGEPAHAGYVGGHSVWWTWTATDSGRVVIDTTGSSFKTLIGVYQGTNVAALSPVANNRNLASFVAFKATRGQTYQIAVDGYLGAVGSIKLSVKLTPGVLDDAQAAYSSGWGTTSGGYQGSMHYSARGSGSNTAMWTFNNLVAGTYRVSVTWAAGSTRASNAPFSVFDGTRLLKTVLVNEKVGPSGTIYDGVTWQTLNSFKISSGVLSIRLSNYANGFVMADGVRIERIA